MGQEMSHRAAGFAAAFLPLRRWRKGGLRAALLGTVLLTATACANGDNGGK